MPSRKRMSCLIRVRPWWVVALILALVTAGCSEDTPTLAGETGTAVEAAVEGGEAPAAGDDEVFTYWGGTDLFGCGEPDVGGPHQPVGRGAGNQN